MAKFTSSSVYDIKKNGPFGNICPSLKLYNQSYLVKGWFLRRCWKRWIPWTSSATDRRRYTLNIFFIFKNALPLGDILLEITTFDDSLNSEWFIIK